MIVSCRLTSESGTNRATCRAITNVETRHALSLQPAIILFIIRRRGRPRSQGRSHHLNVVFAPVYDIILNVRWKLRKIRAEASYADDQISIIFRMYLCVAQFAGINHVVLNMRSAIRHEGVCVCRQFSDAFRTS